LGNWLLRATEFPGRSFLIAEVVAQSRAFYPFVTGRRTSKLDRCPYIELG
jgi:hypothetical protein